MHRRLLLGSFSFLALAGLPGYASAQAGTAFPVRPVRLIVPSSAGSGPDQIARIPPLGLSEKWGQGIVIDNRAGASSGLGLDALSKADPDGYTLLLAAHNVAIVPALAKVSYNPRAFTPIARVATAGMVRVVNPGVPATNLQEFVALVQKSPGKYSYGSAGPGTTHHMMMELLKHVAKLHIVHIPYCGHGPVLPELLEVRVQMAFISSPAALAYVLSGRLRAIAVAGDKRLPQLPNIPTVAESGYKALTPCSDMASSLRRA